MKDGDNKNIESQQNTAKNDSNIVNNIIKNKIKKIKALPAAFGILSSLSTSLLPIILCGILIAAIYENVIKPIVEFFGSSEVSENDVVSMSPTEVEKALKEAGVEYEETDITEMDYEELEVVFDTYEKNNYSIFDSIFDTFSNVIADIIVNDDNDTDLSNVDSSIVRKIFKIVYENKLDQMTEGDVDVDKLPIGVVLSSFNYLYSSQYMNSDRTYDEIVENVNPETGEKYFEIIKTDRVSLYNATNLIVDLLKNNIIEIQDIKDLIDNLVFHVFYPSYTYEEKEQCDEDENGVKQCTITIKCNKKSNDEYKLDYDKYYLYLRYGEDVAGYAFDENAKKYEKIKKGDTSNLYGIGYEFFKNLQNSFSESSELCVIENDFNEYYEKKLADLPNNYNIEIDESVYKSFEFFEKNGVTISGNKNTNHEIFDDFSKYEQIAEEDKNKISTIKINNEKLYNYNDGKQYYYKDGWIYNKFPHYRDELQTITNDKYIYDELLTPLEIESTIYDIDTLKDIYNEVLGYNLEEEIYYNSFNSDGTESFPLPAGKYKITSCVGERTIDGELSNHGGIDIAVSRNTPLYSWKKGTVVSTNNSCGEGFYGNSCGGGYGNYVIIEHISENGEKQYTIYAHMSSVNVSSGDQVSAGQQIGLSGNSGSTTGPHLHFEIRTGGTEWSNSTKQDPYPTLAEIANDPDLSSTCSENTYINVGTTTLTPSTGADSNLANMVLTEADKYVGNTDEEFNKATGVKVSSAWCARFVSYILNKVGVIPTIMKGISSDEGSTEYYYNYFLSNSDGVVWNYSSSSYTPKPGDIIMFNYKKNEGRNVSHIGFVKSVSGDKITYIHGNASNACNSGISSVCESYTLKSNSYLIGFASWY